MTRAGRKRDSNRERYACGKPKPPKPVHYPDQPHRRGYGSNPLAETSHGRYLLDKAITRPTARRWDVLRTEAVSDTGPRSDRLTASVAGSEGYRWRTGQMRTTPGRRRVRSRPPSLGPPRVRHRMGRLPGRPARRPHRLPQRAQRAADGSMASDLSLGTVLTRPKSGYFFRNADGKFRPQSLFCRLSRVSIPPKASPIPRWGFSLSDSPKCPT